MTTCYYCGGDHQDDPCPKRAEDAQRFVENGAAMYPRKEVPTYEEYMTLCGFDIQPKDNVTSTHLKHYACEFKQDEP